MVDEGGVVALAFLEDVSSFVVLSLLAILSQQIVVFIDIYPEVFPIDGEILEA